jgi:site-specific recombinase XerD
MRDVELSEISPGYFEIYKLARQKEKGGARTINKEIAYIRSFFKWAASQQLCNPLDFKVAALPYKPPKPHVLQVDEIVKICKAADLLHRCIFLCLYQAGMRRNEALGLRWEDIYWEQGVVSIHGKGDKERLVPLGEWLLNSLKDLHEKAGIEKGFQYLQREGYIFLNIKTKLPIRDFRKALRSAATKAGINHDVNPHLLRHSVATQMIANGTDIRKVQVFLGHEDISMTQRYTHIAVEFLREHIVDVTTGSNKDSSYSI